MFIIQNDVKIIRNLSDSFSLTHFLFYLFTNLKGD